MMGKVPQVETQSVIQRLYRPTVRVIIDTKKPVDKSVGIIKIRVTYRRVKIPYTTGIKVSPETWERLKKTGPVLDNRVKDEEFINLHRSIYGYEKRNGERVDGWFSKYKKVIDRLGDAFSFEGLREGIKSYVNQMQVLTISSCALDALIRKAEVMNSKDRVGNANLYTSASVSLKRFLKSLSHAQCQKLGLPTPLKLSSDPKLPFKNITPDFLEEYEKWMFQFGKSSHKPGNPPTPASNTTIGIYMRELRAVYNDAIRDKKVHADAYPFGRGKYIIPSGSNPKKALKKEEIERIKSYQPENESEQRAHDLYTFTYYSNGMNMTDICGLKWKDVKLDENCFSFVRKKTQLTTKSDIKKIQVMLRPETKAILERWGTNPESCPYVFPFINDTMTAARRKAVIGQITSLTNKWMNRIAQKLGISENLVTYSARHSFATTLLRSGVPVKYIQDSFGHGSIATTEKYLGSFENEEIQKFLDVL